MCSFCPIGDGRCLFCGAVRLELNEATLDRSRPSDDPSGDRRRVRDRESHQQCGGGRRVIRKRIGRQ